MVEVATRHDKRIFGLSQFNLYTETLAHTYIFGHLASENQIDIEHTVFHFRNDLGNFQRVLFALIVYGGRQAGGDAVDVVFAQLGMNLELVEYLDFGDVRVRSHLLAGSGIDIAQLSVNRCTDNQAFQSVHASEELLLSPFHFVAQKLLADDGHGGVLLQAFHLEGSFLDIVVIFVLAHFQLGFALDAHLVFFLFQPEALLEATHFVLRLECLLFQGKALLFHLYFTLLIRIALVLPLVALVFYFAYQVGVGEYQDGIALLHHRAFFGHDAFHTSRLAGIYFDGQNRLYQSFHIHVFHELAVLYFGYLDIVCFDAEFSRSQ